MTAAIRACADAMESPGPGVYPKVDPYHDLSDGAGDVLGGVNRLPFTNAADVTAEIARLRAAADRIDAIPTNP